MREYTEFPAATVIVPVKGGDGGDEFLAANLASLAGQDYLDYELIVVARSAADIPAGVVPEKARVVFSGDGDPASGETNQQFAGGGGGGAGRFGTFGVRRSDNEVAPGWLRSCAASYGTACF